MTTTTTFAYTGANQNFIVPAGVTSLTFVLNGAGGGYGSAAGAGERLAGTLAVTPGETLVLQIGGKGGTGGAGVNGTGGWPNGGASIAGSLGTAGGGGGGSTELKRSTTLRLVAAGGGGTCAGGPTGGDGGTTTGQAGGANGVTGGGGGGTPTTGGAGGTAGTGGVAGTVGGTGTTGNGGAAGTGLTNAAAARTGGGGGGGFRGGGGGGSANSSGAGGAGGGGGSGSSTGATGVTDTRGGGAAALTNGSATLTYNQPPNAPTPSSPASNAWLDVAVAQTFSWVPSDPDVTDSPSAADFQYRIVGAGSWTAVAISGSTASTILAAGALTTGNQYEWQVRTYDTSGAVGPWSASTFFRTTVAPSTAPTITSPAAASNLQGNNTVFTWTTLTTQASYEVVVNPDSAGAAVTGTVLTDTGEVVSTGHSTAVDVGAVLNGQVLHIRVRYSEHAGSGIWSPWADNGAQLVNYSPPTVPTLVLTASTAAATVTIAITNPATGAPVVANDLYRQNLTTGEAEERLATGLAPNATWVDQFPAFNTSLRYRVVAFNGFGAFTSSA